MTQFGDTDIRIGKSAESPAGLAALLCDDQASRVPLLHFSNGVFRGMIEYVQHAETRSYTLGATLSLADYRKPRNLFDVERKFNCSNAMIYQQAQAQLAQMGVPAVARGGSLFIGERSSLSGTGSLHFYRGNEYRRPGPEALGEATDLLGAEIALCAVCLATLYDMANLVVLNHRVDAGAVVADLFSAELGLNVDAQIAYFIDPVLSEELRTLRDWAIASIEEADTALIGKGNLRRIH